MDLKKQIESIIEDLANDAPISRILLKAQAIAFYIKDETFANWIKAEQNGYVSYKNLPEYRKVKCGVKANISVPFRGMYTNMDVPVDAIGNKEIREILSTILFLEPISEIEEMGKADDSNSLRMNVPAFTYSTINQFYPHGNVEGAWKFTNTSTATAIISIVKTKLLDFFLNFEQQISIDVNFDVMANKEKIQTIVNQFIKAGVVNTGNGSVSVTRSEIIEGNDYVTLSCLERNAFTNIIKEIETINEKYNNEDLAYELSEIRKEMSKPQQDPRFIKQVFNAIKGISSGIIANELTPIVEKGIEVLSKII